MNRETLEKGVALQEGIEKAQRSLRNFNFQVEASHEQDKEFIVFGMTSGKTEIPINLFRQIGGLLIADANKRIENAQKELDAL